MVYIFRIKLFLEQFGIPACVLNSELPVSSRYVIYVHHDKKHFVQITYTVQSPYNAMFGIQSTGASPVFTVCHKV